MEPLDPTTLKTATALGSTAALVNGLVMLLKMEALGDFWRKVLPWWAKIVIFLAAAVASAVISALAAGLSPGLAVLAAVSGVLSAIGGREMKEFIRLAIAEKAEEDSASSKKTLAAAKTTGATVATLLPSGAAKTKGPNS